MSGVGTFGGVCETWSSNCRLWSDCIYQVVEEVFGGARDPQFWHDPPFYEELDKYQEKNPQKKAVLIEILVKCANKKYKNKFKLPEKKAVVTVDDVRFILSTLKEVGVDVKNIRKYNDDDLNNLLS
jgi:hypothetical protein